MFAAWFETFSKDANEEVENYKDDFNTIEVISRQKVEDMLTELDKTPNVDAQSVSCINNGDDALKSPSIDVALDDHVNDVNSFDCSEDAKNEMSSVEENKLQKRVNVDNAVLKKTINQINNLQCPFTWQLKVNTKKNVSKIQNKYGNYNLDISLAEFTLERFVGNIIIAYELFHKKSYSKLGQMKILQIGKWLEELDTGNDEFYLSINTGLKHVMSATFIHMLFATGLVVECKWLFDDIDSFANMDPKPRASVHAIRALVLTEYDGNDLYFKKACECAKKSCDLDPNNSHWFYIYSLVLTAQRHFLHSIKSNPTDSEIIAIQKAIELSDGRNTFYNYHRMILDKDATIYNYHNNINKSDELMMEENLQENQTLVQMIKTIVSMEPKDPHLVIKCAQTLMTLPFKVRDLKLGKQYLKIALDMAPNDPSVLKAISKVAEACKITSKNNISSPKTRQNQPKFKKKSSSLGEDIAVLVENHKSGQDVLSSLYSLLNNEKYNGSEKCKISAQLCSFTLLFKNDLKSSIEHFMTLIEMPEITNNHILIESHASLFGSKRFNLAELICNEIRLAINTNGTSSEDMLFYIKMLTKIMETCNLKIQDLDSFMKSKLIINTSTRLSCDSTAKNQKEIFDFSDIESVSQSEHSTKKWKSRNQSKHLQNTGPQVFIKKTQGSKQKSNSKGNTNNNSSNKTVPKNKNASNILRNKSYQTKSSSIDELMYKMSKFSPEFVQEPSNLNNSKYVNVEDIKNIRTRAEINTFTQKLYENILQQRNLEKANSQVNNMFLNQNHPNYSNNTLQKPPPPPLLSLKPHVNVQDLINLKKQRKTYSKKQ